MPPGSPAQVWMGAVLVTSSGLRIVVTALPMIRLNIKKKGGEVLELCSRK